MFKTNYTAMMQNIAPTESICQQVLSAMQEEERRQMPTILPVKQAASRRPVWTLVACAAMVTVAVALTWVLMKGEKPPMLPGGVTTSVAQTTTDTTTVTTHTTVTTDTTVTANTTVENWLVPPSVTETLPPTGSTTVAPTTPPISSVSSTTGTTAGITTTVTLPPVGNYDDLFQWLESFTTTLSKDEPFPTAPPTAPPTTPTTPTTEYPATESPSAPTDFVEDITPIPGATTSYKEIVKTTSPPTTTVAMPTRPSSSGTNPSQPAGGTITYETVTVGTTSQRGDRVVAQLQGDSVVLMPLNSTGDEYLSVIKPPMAGDIAINGFTLYGDRLVIVGQWKNPRYAAMSHMFVYDIHDPAAPLLVEQFHQDGQFLGAHQVDGVLYTISYYLPQNIQPNRPESYIPHVYQQNSDTVLSLKQIVPAAHPTCNGYTLLTAVSLKGTPAMTSAMALYGQDNAYVSVYTDAVVIRSKPYTNGQNQTVSDLVKATLDKGHIAFVSRTTVKE